MSKTFTRRSYQAALVTVALSVTSAVTHAADDEAQVEEAATACDDAASLIRDGDIDGALEEARWCVESLQQLRQVQTLAAFPDVVDGFAGGTLDNQSAMGMNAINRRYESGSDVVTVTLTTGVAGGGLAALAQLGAGLAGGTGKKLRIQKRTVLDMSNETSSQFMVQLRSGGMLQISSDTLDREGLRSFAESFPIEKLDESLKR